MEIITHQERKVKPDFVLWEEKKRANIQMAHKMAKAGYKKRAFMMEHCGDRMMFGKCENCGAVEVQHANLCRDRLVPFVNGDCRGGFFRKCAVLCCISTTTIL